MKQLTALALSLTLALGLLSGCGAKDDGQKEPAGELNLYTWDNLYSKEVLDGFTEETGIKINYSSFDSNETMLAKLEASKGGDYDLVLADDYIIDMAIQEGLVQKLDKEQLPNFKNLNPAYQGQYFDPDDAYTVPFGAGVQTIAYHPDLVDIEIRGFDDLLDPSLRDSIGITNNTRVLHGMALISMGKSVNEEDPAVLQQVGEKMKQLAPNIRFIKDDNPQDDLIAGEIAVGLLYTSQVTQACIANPDLKVVYPEEGVGFGVMSQFIPSHAPHAKEAHLFLDYMMRPEVAKEAAQAAGYYCTNQAADPLIDEEYRELLTLPEELKMEEMEMARMVSPEAMDLHALLWTEFRTACGQ